MCIRYRSFINKNTAAHGRLLQHKATNDLNLHILANELTYDHLSSFLP
jgi:hypothetical protein